MTQTEMPTHDALPAHAQLIQMATGAFVTKILHVAAKLGLADHLADGARSANELAAALDAHPDSLHRFMRTLAGLGVLTERAEGRFALTSLGSELRSNAPGCARSTLITLGGAGFSAAFEHLEHAVRTGQTGFERAWGMPVFDYLAARRKKRGSSVRPWLGFTVLSLRRSPRPTISRRCEASSTSAARLATCSLRSCSATAHHVECCSIDLTSSLMQPRC
jgi:hypothetical protein